MNRVSNLSRTVAVVAVFTAAPTYATQPGQTVNPNGFPSGEHNDLNILVVSLFPSEPIVLPGKGNPVYGNVFLVRLNGNFIY